MTTIFVNSSAVDFKSHDEDTFTFVENFHVSSKESVETVLARKLLVVPQGQSDWRNFIIPAEAGNINRRLQEEKTRDLSDELTTRFLAELPIVLKPGPMETKTSWDDSVSDGTNEKSTAFNRSKTKESKILKWQSTRLGPLTRCRPELQAQKTTGIRRAILSTSLGGI